MLVWLRGPDVDLAPDGWKPRPKPEGLGHAITDFILGPEQSVAPAHP